MAIFVLIHSIFLSNLDPDKHEWVTGLPRNSIVITLRPADKQKQSLEESG